MPESQCWCETGHTPQTPSTEPEKTRTLIARLPMRDCRSGIINAIRSARSACAITVAGRQFALRFLVNDQTILSCQILQHRDSTLWMHFFRPKMVFDVSRRGYVAEIAQAEVNIAINTFSLFPGTCRIISEPQQHHCAHAGLDAKFLGISGCEYNLQDVELVPSRNLIAVDYKARLCPQPQATPIASKVVSISGHKKPELADISQATAHASDCVIARIKSIVAENADYPPIVLSQTMRRPAYQHRQRLHLR